MDLGTILTRLSETRPIFHNEADFQHALAWAIQKHYPEATIRLEMKVLGQKARAYLDILVSIAGRKYGIELKYKTRTFETVINGEGFSLSNHGAQDTGRYDVLKDLQRLEQMVIAGVIDEGRLVFLTNDSSYYSSPMTDKLSIDRDFRLHEGRLVQGKLSWGALTGQGTMKGREESITIHGQYILRWSPYGHLADQVGGEFDYLVLPVGDVHELPNTVDETSSVITRTKANDTVVVTMRTTQEPPSWFESFSRRGEVLLSQIDLRDKLANHLRDVGYSVSVNRDVGTARIDIWAEGDEETLAIEVRNKTALLQTVYRGKDIHLKNQAAQDISRYDFVNDIGKLERVVGGRHNVKGYALLVTNDAMYWKPPKKNNAVDSKFRIHGGQILSGSRAWSGEAATGTTTGREQPIHLNGSYRLEWLPYLSVGSLRNMEFRALLVGVTNRG